MESGAQAIAGAGARLEATDETGMISMKAHPLARLTMAGLGALAMACLALTPAQASTLPPTAQEVKPAAAPAAVDTSTSTKAVQQSGKAAPNPRYGLNKPIFFVHGYISESRGYDCADYWRAAIDNFKDDRTWDDSKAEAHTFGYYRGSTNCDFLSAAPGDGDQSTSIKAIGRELATVIYDKYSRFGKTVDVVGHSMGGLVIRAAITGTQRNEKGFPPYLRVEDVTTIATPHNGSVMAGLCKWRQCKEMREGSKLLRWLDDNPQSEVLTDWTAIASEWDWFAPADSAIHMSAVERIIYHDPSVPHWTIHQTVDGRFRYRYSNCYMKWKEMPVGRAREPVEAARQASKELAPCDLGPDADSSDD